MNSPTSTRYADLSDASAHSGISRQRLSNRYESDDETPRKRKRWSEESEDDDEPARREVSDGEESLPDV